jgi:hypothetical protein
VSNSESFVEALKNKKVKGISRYLRLLYPSDKKIIPLNKAQTSKFSETINCGPVLDVIKNIGSQLGHVKA